MSQPQMHSQNQQVVDPRMDQTSNPTQNRNLESDSVTESMNPTKAIMEVLSQTLRTQGESAAILQ
eukprot:458507-Rhodomonas_salina.1